MVVVVRAVYSFVVVDLVLFYIRHNDHILLGLMFFILFECWLGKNDFYLYRNNPYGWTMIISISSL